MQNTCTRPINSVHALEAVQLSNMWDVIDYIDIWHIDYQLKTIKCSAISRAVFVRFSLGGGWVEFRLTTSDYSGHGGCQIGTVE